jgi:hypothetical protein
MSDMLGIEAGLRCNVPTFLEPPLGFVDDGLTFPQGALRAPGLWNGTALRYCHRRLVSNEDGFCPLL